MKYFKEFDEVVNENFIEEPTYVSKAVAAATEIGSTIKDAATNAGKKVMAAVKDNAPAATAAVQKAAGAVVDTAKSAAGVVSDAVAPTTPAAPLQAMLKEWSQKYSQSFKFINDKPFTNEVTTDLKGQGSMLLSVIVAEKRQQVQEAINKIVDVLADPKFAGYNVQIIGHTSTPGPKGREKIYNQSLSERRASIVYNAIAEKALEQKKDMSKIKFAKIGKGLTDPIIINDKVLDAIQVKQMDGKFDEATLNSISQSVEERQKINRRVIITLPDYKEPVPVAVVKAPEVKSAREVEAPNIPTQGIRFNPDSYVLSDEGMVVLDNIINEINIRSKGNGKIGQITYSTHTQKMKGGDEREKMMYILSLNRSYTIRDYMISNLKDNKVVFKAYACGSNLSLSENDTIKGQEQAYNDEKRVQMTFDEDLPRAREVYKKQSAKFNLKVQNVIIPNTDLKKTIIADINSYFEDDVTRSQMVASMTKRKTDHEFLKKIPSEFWLDKLTEGVPDKYAEVDSPDEFKDDVRTLFRKMNRKYGTSLNASAIFHDALRRIDGVVDNEKDKS